jgi:hypothetical protein
VKIGIPVKCQNGHRATWVIKIQGLIPKPIGVNWTENCSCPKSNFGEGWSVCGEPFVMEDSTEGELSSLGSDESQIQDEE